MFGYDNDANVFINQYKTYVNRWSNVKKETINVSDDDFVMGKMVEILKSITLDYSSYEEQDFIANIDLTNKSHIKALCALYSRKIRQITEFYRKKRNESVLIVHKNSLKGSVKSIEEIIYEKVFDYLFSDRNTMVSYANIKRDLMISVENYVDVYSEYFDIPRQKEFTDKTRAEMLSSNINDVDYRTYLEIELVISEILFSGNVYLEEIPLVAQLGVDLSQNCVGDMLALKNTLLANTTINQVPLTEQVALKRKLYEKYLGCDLHYLYVDLQGNITMDVLCKAKNPTGNLLNCGTADTATVESDQLELLSHIGLFFKPDKISILKVNAKKFTWEIDTSLLENDTIYVFPDPNRYGDIGNNKSAQYPLIMEYKLDWDVKNISSGEAVNDPLIMIGDQGWRSYYSKQDDDFKVFDNKNFEYAFTSLADKGRLKDYQTDAWGNQFGLFVQCPCEGETISLQDVLDTSINAVHLNGGYFEDPKYKGQEVWDEEKEKFVWIFETEEDNAIKFDFTEQRIINENCIWSGISVHNDKMFNVGMNQIDCGMFGAHKDIKYVDNFQVAGKGTETSFINDEPLCFNYYDPIGKLYVRLSSSIYNKPQLFQEVFPWTEPLLRGKKLIGVQVIHENVIIETEESFIFVPYLYDGEKISNVLENESPITLKKSGLGTKMIYITNDRSFYIMNLENEESLMLPHVYKFNPKSYSLEEVINSKNEPNEDLRLENFTTNNFTFDFSHNSSLNIFTLTIMYNDELGLPVLCNYKFKMIDLETFNATLDGKWFTVSEKINVSKSLDDSIFVNQAERMMRGYSISKPSFVISNGDSGWESNVFVNGELTNEKVEGSVIIKQSDGEDWYLRLFLENSIKFNFEVQRDLFGNVFGKFYKKLKLNDDSTLQIEVTVKGKDEDLDAKIRLNKIINNV